ncbi:MAG: CDP-alcohol phosphatidyltransferase family protein [Bacteroidales bacterium]|nr:CDP-alcohol phosphatidyltransferase family protein [Bacteroidales bacterium]
MAIKDKASQARNTLDKGLHKGILPLCKVLIACGFTPNAITTIGFLGNLAAACVLAYAGYAAPHALHPEYWLLTLAGALIIGFSLFDMLDGAVARVGGMESTFGAMYDSVLDRYCELLTLGGAAYYLISIGHPVGAFLTFLALVGSIMVSYVRARGEGLGVVCKIGFMQRPERVVVTSLAVLATGICGQCHVGFDPNWILIIAMAFIAVFANLTAFARIGWCKRALKDKEKK